jgi:hypothetical protein
MKAEDIEFIVNSYKNEKPGIKEEIKDELTEEEAIDIYNDLIKVLASHNVSYKCALNISISLMYAFMTGAAELYDNEMNP